MKLLLLTLLLCSTSLFAQNARISVKSQQDIDFIWKHRVEIERGDAFLLTDLPVNEFDGTYYVSFLGKKGVGINIQTPSDGSVFFGKSQGDIYSIRIRLSDLMSVYEINGFSNIEIAGKIKPSLDKVVFDTRVDSVHAGYGLPEKYTGKDVIIGITDWGFDYSSPMFYDTLLENTRIVAAWDQFKTSGPAPNGYSYGTEYDTSSEFVAAGADTANIYSYATHGTHVAGIAGGSGAGLAYRGMAFESGFLFTTFLVDEAAVLDAWEWMYQRALMEGKRLVMNMSWGLYHFGTNDGNSLLSQAISDYSNLGVVFATSGGNNGNVNFHTAKTFANDSLKTRVEFYSYASNPNMWGQSLHAWGEAGNDFEMKISVNNASNVMLVESDYFPASMNGTLDTFIVNNLDTIWLLIAAEQNHPLNNRPTIRLRVKNTVGSYKIGLHARASAGKVHFWNVTELVTDVGNWGMPFSSLGSNSIIGDHFYGIGEPAASDDLIAVAAHAASFVNGGGTLSGGARASFSSIGPRYDEVLKPDISAPGVNVMSSISSYTDNAFTLQSQVSFQGRDYPFARFSGTSMSSPAVAGICALILDANPFLSAQQVKDIVIETARLDNYTGAIPTNGDAQWGHGKIDAYSAIQLALITVGTEELMIEDRKIIVYPNPTTDFITIQGVDIYESIQVIDMNGKVFEPLLQGNQLNISGLTSGYYFLRVISEGKVYQTKFVKSR